MLAVIIPDIEEVRQTAKLLAASYPLDALRIADALADDNRDAGDARRAEMWTQVAIVIAELQRKSLS